MLDHTARELIYYIFVSSRVSGNSPKYERLENEILLGEMFNLLQWFGAFPHNTRRITNMFP